MIREALKRISEAKVKKDVIYSELGEWLKVLYPDMEIQDDKKYNPFKGMRNYSKEPYGKTTFIFKNGKEAKEAQEKIEKTSKFRGIPLTRGMNVLEVIWTKPYTETQYKHALKNLDKLGKDLKSDLGDALTDEHKLDAAKTFLNQHQGLASYMKNQLNIHDPLGSIVNKIN